VKQNLIALRRGASSPCPEGAVGSISASAQGPGRGSRVRLSEAAFSAAGLFALCGSSAAWMSGCGRPSQRCNAPFSGSPLPRRETVRALSALRIGLARMERDSAVAAEEEEEEEEEEEAAEEEEEAEAQRSPR
jgi:hypothetical protein